MPLLIYFHIFRLLVQAIMVYVSDLCFVYTYFSTVTFLVRTGFL